MRLKNGVEVSTVSILTVNPEEPKCVFGYPQEKVTSENYLGLKNKSKRLKSK